MSNNANSPCGHCGGNHRGGKGRVQGGVAVNPCTRPGKAGTPHATNSNNFCGGCFRGRGSVPSVTRAPSTTPAQGQANQFGVLRSIVHVFAINSGGAVTRVNIDRSLPTVLEEYSRFGTLTMDMVSITILPSAGTGASPAGSVWTQFGNTNTGTRNLDRMLETGATGTNVVGGATGAIETFQESFGRASRDLSPALRSPPVPGLVLYAANDSNVTVRVRVEITARGLSPQDPNAITPASRYAPEPADANNNPTWIIVRDEVNPRFATVRLSQGRRFGYVSGVLNFSNTGTPSQPLAFAGVPIRETSFPGLVTWVNTIRDTGVRVHGNHDRVLIWIGE